MKGTIADDYSLSKIRRLQCRPTGASLRHCFMKHQLLQLLTKLDSAGASTELLVR